MTDNHRLCFSDVSQAVVLGVVGCVGAVERLLKPGVGPVCLRSAFALASLRVRLQGRGCNGERMRLQKLPGDGTQDEWRRFTIVTGRCNKTGFVTFMGENVLNDECYECLSA